MKLIKRILVGLILMSSNLAICQEIELVGRIDLPDGYVSSESRLAVTTDGKLVAAILCVRPESENASYTSVIFESLDMGKTWKPSPAMKFPEAADPWIIAGLNETLFFCDISEGNRFHLKTQVFDGNQWLEPQTHGMGHDHGMVVSDGSTSYLISTQNEGWTKKLYLAELEMSASSFGAAKVFEIFSHSDFSIKQPALVGGKLIIPVALRGQFIDSLQTQNFQTMTSWLITYDPKTGELSSPSFITDRSGGRHHVLAARNENIYYVYTDPAQAKLELISSLVLGKRWSKPLVVSDTTTSNWVNLDAVLTTDEYLVICHTEKYTEGYQKYISLYDFNKQSIVKRFALGDLSKPDTSNGWVLRAWPQGGDYCGMVQGPDDDIYLLWSHASGGPFYPVIAKIKIK